MIPIVLTGTIVPNAIKVAHCNWQERRNEYLAAISYYKNYSKVYFLENSHYDLSQDSQFANDGRFEYVKCDPSGAFDKGKGYQEFQMLDGFVRDRLNDDSFVKVTGRYIYENFGELFRLIIKEGQKHELMIDTSATARMAMTALFYANRSAYLRHFAGRFREMDDSAGVWAEHVIYRALKDVAGPYSFLPRVPILSGISGSTGKRCVTDRNILKMGIKNAQRRVFSVLGIRQLLR
jgi:hypothetical protein